MKVRWAAFPLHPEVPDDGITLEALFAGRSIQIKKALVRLKQVADELGLPLGERKKTYNSRLAQELAKWAESQGRGDPFHEAVFRAYFVDGKNISKVGELVALAKAVGLPEKKARSVLDLRAFREAVDADWERSRVLGMTGVPTFVVDDKMAVGFQPYEELERFLRSFGIKKR